MVANREAAQQEVAQQEVAQQEVAQQKVAQQKVAQQQLTGGAEARAAGLGIRDALVFRRLSASRWAHLGGLGRGRGWAGLVDVDAANEPLLGQAPAQPGGVHTFCHSAPERVLGPYYAVGGALVRVSNDVLVLLGHPTEPFPAGVTDSDLRELAFLLDTDLEDIAPSKRLGDELEVLHAVRAVTTGVAEDLFGTLRHVLDVAVQSLSCEVGLLRDGAGRTVATSSWSGVDVDAPGVGAALDVLHERAGGAALCIQDTDSDPVLAPLGRGQGVRSLLAIAIPEPVGGVLVVAHTSAGPRGFTTLCQQLGRQVADAAGVVAHTAALREELRTAVDEHARAARRDPLTGLGNRLAWDEALAACQDNVDAGGRATVITLDVDGLKQVNDACGHEAGDTLLRRCADVLREHGRDGDVCVRLGGDEFGLLLPLAGPLVDDRLASLRVRLGGVTSCESTVAASVGAATVPPGGRVADAAREADASMYAAKRSRRAPAADRPQAVPAQARPAVPAEARSASGAQGGATELDIP